MSLKQKIEEYKYPALLIILWVCIQSILFSNSGIFINGEAEKYINGANEIVYYGRFPFHYISYATYVLFLAGLFKIGFSYFGIYLVQLFLNIIATVAFFRIVKTITERIITAYYATFIFILFYHLQHWNTHLFTESFMVSMLIITWYGFLYFNLKKASGIAALIILLILLLFSRPTAILFLPAMFVYWIIKNKQLLNGIKITWILSAAISIVLLLFCFVLLDKRVLFSDLFISFRNGEVICSTSYYQERFVALNQEHAYLQNLFIFCKVSAKKMCCFYGFIRPFYSKAHNMMLMAFYPVYPLAIIGLIKSKIQKEHLFMMLTFILLINALLLITCDSWEGRFIVPALPFIIVFAAIGLTRITQKTSS